MTTTAAPASTLTVCGIPCHLQDSSRPTMFRGFLDDDPEARMAAEVSQFPGRLERGWYAVVESHRLPSGAGWTVEGPACATPQEAVRALEVVVRELAGRIGGARP